MPQSPGTAARIRRRAGSARSVRAAPARRCGIAGDQRQGIGVQHRRARREASASATRPTSRPPEAPAPAPAQRRDPPIASASHAAPPHPPPGAASRRPAGPHFRVRADGGQPSVTKPAPTRSAARAASRAAPPRPTPPARTSAWPWSYLCPPSSRSCPTARPRSQPRRRVCGYSPSRHAARPMSATTNLPRHPGPDIQHMPQLGAVEGHRQAGRMLQIPARRCAPARCRHRCPHRISTATSGQPLSCAIASAPQTPGARSRIRPCRTLHPRQAGELRSWPSRGRQILIPDPPHAGPRAPAHPASLASPSANTSPPTCPASSRAMT